MKDKIIVHLKGGSFFEVDLSSKIVALDKNFLRIHPRLNKDSSDYYNSYESIVLPADMVEKFEL